MLFRSRQSADYERLAKSFAAARGISVQSHRIDNRGQILEAFRRMEAERPDALLVFMSPRLNSTRREVIELAGKLSLPSIAHQEG